MRTEILCVGSELLLGQIIDTNAAYIATQLARAGIDVYRKQVVGDNLDRIVDCIRGALSRADALIITGGLGPTTDDLTREGIAAALGVELEPRPELEKDLREFFARRGVTPTANNLKQAQLPAGSRAIPNPVGTAPGVQAETADGKFIFAVPGVPREMRVLIDETVIPALLERMEGERNIIVSRTLRTFGIGESALAAPLEDILTTAENPTVAPLIYGKTEVHLRLTAKARNEEDARVLLDGMEPIIRERVGDYIFGVDDETLATVAIRLLTEAGKTVAVAESLTGGMLHSMLTDVPGASAALRGGVVTYHSDLKRDLLGVSPQLIETEGVVNAATAAAMADGVRRLCGADIGLATTGEAGPSAASRTAIGTVFIGLSANGHSETTDREYHGDREAIRMRSSLAALDLLRRYLL